MTVISCPELYAHRVIPLYDGFAVRLEFRSNVPELENPLKTQSLPVMRIALAPSAIRELRELLKELDSAIERHEQDQSRPSAPE